VKNIHDLNTFDQFVILNLFFNVYKQMMRKVIIINEFKSKQTSYGRSATSEEQEEINHKIELKICA